MKIEQVLHGYSDGHQLLASSTTALSLSDRRKMSLLSDWNEYVSAQEDDSSYMMCYPLPDSPYYVVAKTWYADEKERPGCVWTHSLLLDIQGQTSFFDYELLYSLFRRPKEGDYGFYENALEIGENAQRELISGEYDAMPSLDYWLWQMLANKVPLMLTYQGNSLKSQQLVLSLMNHIPKAMLRGMSLCSGTGRLMKYDGAVFDFQLTSEARRNIPKLNGRVSNDDKVEGWYKTIADSIVQDGIDIPMLINRFSDEIGIRNDALGAVVLVFSLVDRLKEPGDGNEQKFQLALRIMATAFPEKEQGKRFKSVILAESVSRYFFGEDVFVYQMSVTKYWEAFDYEKLNFAIRARVYFKSHQISEFTSMLEGLLECKEDNPYKQTVFDSVDIEYNQLQVENLIDEHWKLFCCLAQKNDKALNNDFWLNTGKEKFTELVGYFFKKLPQEYLYWRPLLEKMLEYNYAADTFQIETLSSHVSDMSAEILFELNEGHYLNSGWVGYCKRNPLSIIEWLGGQGTVSKQIVSLVLDVIDPESEMVKRSENTKWRVLQSAPVELGAKLDFAVFLFLLSYNIEKDELAFSLYRRAFQTIYEATEKSQIGYYWRRISAYCPRPFLGLEWDKCELLRKGFANRVYDEERNIGTARNFTTEKRINKKLLKAVARKFESEG